MMRNAIKRCAVAIAAWLPFFAIWFLFALSYPHDRFLPVLISTLISMGSAGLLGIAVWYLCKRWPLPHGFKLSFFLLQIGFAIAYGAVWTVSLYGLELLHGGHIPQMMASWVAARRQLLEGVWFYTIFAGLAYAVQTRSRLHEKETLAAKAEALAAAARLDAVRARLNPHFLFNALHTLSALVKFRPAMAEAAIERLGDMLRYALKEDGRELVEFSEEYDFTRQYLAFEQLRYEDRLKVDLQIDQQSFSFDVPPFSIQTLAENAVRHAISIRANGGSIWIKCSCDQGRLTVVVRDDGPGNGSDAGQSHQLGLRSLRERLRAAYGTAADLRVNGSSEGFEASFDVPSPEAPVAKRERAG
jgi:signal transduction histidine kinase